jgi:hypothetical protein
LEHPHLVFREVMMEIDNINSETLRLLAANSGDFPIDRLELRPLPDAKVAETDACRTTIVNGLTSSGITTLSSLERKGPIRVRRHFVVESRHPHVVGLHRLSITAYEALGVEIRSDVAVRVFSGSVAVTGAVLAGEWPDAREVYETFFLKYLPKRVPDLPTGLLPYPREEGKISAVSGGVIKNLVLDGFFLGHEEMLKELTISTRMDGVEGVADLTGLSPWWIGDRPW